MLHKTAQSHTDDLVNDANTHNLPLTVLNSRQSRSNDRSKTVIGIKVLIFPASHTHTHTQYLMKASHTVSA